MGAMAAVACGHEATADAAREILSDGGNAFDAALAAMCAATVVEPVFCSLGGCGFMLAGPADGPPRLYDFFAQTPLRRRPAAEVDFYPIHADFGTVTQEFHIGLGSMATPGAVRGLFAIHADLARLPMTRLVEPAVRLAREGVPLRPIDHFIFRVVGPILSSRADSRAVYIRPDGDLLHEGDLLRQPDLANSLEALAREGEALFHEGEMGRLLAAAARDGGGHLSLEDLARYRVERRHPLERRYRGARILTNPPPSSGGILIAFALALLAEAEVGALAFGSEAHLALLTRVMALTNRARVESGLHEALADAEGTLATRRLLDPDLLAAYAARVHGRPAARRGTTHISIIDSADNMAAISLSNGEGCGYVIPGSGILMNNMLGEEDLNPEGFEAWPEGTRMTSMMAPTLAYMADGGIAALGSGGSNRIRTAILQVLLNMIDFAMPTAEAVEAPRLHFERGLLNIEAGFGYDVAEAVERSYPGLCDDVMMWEAKNLFFGGVHAAARLADGTPAAGGDPRRGGVTAIVETA